MSSASPFVDYKPGEVILSEGTPASALFIIESGQVVVARAAEPDRVLTELGPGDFFGEMAILQEQAHSATVTACGPVRALRIDIAAFHGVLRENVEIAVQLMRRLVMRLQASEARLSAAGASASPAGGPSPAAVAPADPSVSTEAPPAAPAPESAPVALVLRHCDGEIVVPAGKSELMVGRPDPATGAVPEINLGPVDTARTLSRRHARLLLAEGRWVLREEPGVGNGTWVNGERLHPDQSISVRAGDKLRFGAIEVELVRD